MGWSKTELSKRTGISVQLLCDIEAGRRRPSLDNLIILAKTLNFSLDKIFLAQTYA
jgi:transcriptional regulator with XRE-family HTH domain